MFSIYLKTDMTKISFCTGVTYYNAEFGQGNSIAFLGCHGSEYRLNDCYYNFLNNTNDYQYEDDGVYCGRG